MPLKEINGFGSFKEQFCMLSWSSSEKAEKETRGIPNDWEEFYVKQIWSDSFQVTYQDYIKRGCNKIKFDADSKGWAKKSSSKKIF